MELSTIQKREKLNQVFSEDEIGPGGAKHKYLIMSNEGNAETKEPLVMAVFAYKIQNHWPK